MAGKLTVEILVADLSPIMAQLSESKLNHIKVHPIKDGFKALLATFKSTY